MKTMEDHEENIALKIKNKTIASIFNQKRLGILFNNKFNFEHIVLLRIH